MGAHGGGERPSARHFRDPLAIDLFQRSNAKALQQADAFAQRRFEADLAAHRALGDFRDLRLQSQFGGKLVDAFLLDDGRIHVRDEELLAAAFGGLRRNVEVRILERRARARVGRGRVAVEGNVAGMALGEPRRFGGGGQRRAGRVHMGACKRRRLVAYQGQDVFHRENRIGAFS
jgi:hypothetical protein